MLKLEELLDLLRQVHYQIVLKFLPHEFFSKNRSSDLLFVPLIVIEDLDELPLARLESLLRQ